ncbi:uncharacterized protein LOC124944895 [Impatiens glandulifera]|uniref:uncharacterized protein LOC124944895 n=1 Tax=Impatiens glandulifera TaxID=253017 RepID=UPI001FB0AAE6|nr:uncharacterized protein LOC124944895 [Impatiens glandulifera]
MLNGEETHRASSIGDACTDPLEDFMRWNDPESDRGDDDDSPVPSRYSSAGDSEFDRYCSANSVMGTPSLCSSFGKFNDCESDFGSVRSYGLGISSSLDNLRMEDGLRGKVEDRRLSILGGSSSGKMTTDERNLGREIVGDLQKDDHSLTDIGGHVESRSNENKGRLLSLVDLSTSLDDELFGADDEGGIVRWKNQSELDDALQMNAGHSIEEALSVNSDSHASEDEHLLPPGQEDIEPMVEYLEGAAINVYSELEGGRGVDRYSDQDALSSCTEHSESEDSQFGTANYEQKRDLHKEERNLEKFREAKNDRIVSLWMNSSTAFGSDDLHDFMQENGDSDIIMIKLDQLMEQKQPHDGTNINREQEEKDLIPVDGNSQSAVMPSANKVYTDDGSTNYENPDSNISKVLHPLSSITSRSLCPIEAPVDQRVDFFEGSYSLPLTVENTVCKTSKDSPILSNPHDMDSKIVKIENLESNELYNEVVHEMEEILLDSTDSPSTWFPSQKSFPLRDGGSTASTSGNDDAYPQMQCRWRIDRVEVVGAKQKKGDISFSERLVGVKEYTVYVIRAWSGTDHWMIERRYRDFCTLHRRLKAVSSDQGWLMPSPWSSIEQESRKIFGNLSPDVVSERSELIQECLQSILHLRFTYGLPNALVWFLSPTESHQSSPASSSSHQLNLHFPFEDGKTENVSALGKTISLIVEISPLKTLKQNLEAQHYTCAGCHKHFDDGKTRLSEVVHSFGWGRPRICEYTSQLFCSSCHTNDFAVLPARVLHNWDFSQYPVSQLAKSYLDSIRDQPMLCVSAVNPFLFSKVPALHQVTGMRKKIGAMIPYVNCQFRESIFKRLGSRKYLLESNDFFALRDLIDLSKGAFAALPVMVDTVSRKIREHIMEQCLLCCDVGVPCNARHACNDLSSLIFPFQEEDELERCRSCKSVFHVECFKKIKSCPCGVLLRHEEDGTGLAMSSQTSSTSSSSSSLKDLFGRKSVSSKSTIGLLSGLFYKEKSPVTKDRDTVILMGSFPNNSK